MQKFKKPVSILLVFMMIVSLFAAVPMTVNAAPPGGDGPGGIGTEIEIGSGAVGDFVPESEYLTFTAVEAGASVTLKYTGGTLQYNINNSGWQSYTVGSLIALAKGDSVRFRGKNTTFNGSNHVSIDGKVACSGNVMSLRLDDDGMSQGLSTSCFSNMFYGCTGLTAAPELPETTLAAYCYSNMFKGCTNLTAAPALPATTLVTSCYSEMFAGCTSLTTAPKLPATKLAPMCYQRMFYVCTSLTTAPELPATTLEYGCYGYMFAGCESIKLSETQTAEYSIPYSVPSGGDATPASPTTLKNMFAGTGGTFTGTPTINKTYYVPASTVPVTDLDFEEHYGEVTVGGKTALTAMIEPDDATDKTVKWSVTQGSDKIKLYEDADCTTEVGEDATDCLTVYVMGVAEGDAVVTVTSNADPTIYAYCDVNVKVPETITIDLNPDNASVIWYDATDSDGNWSMEAAYNDSCYLVLKGNSDQPAGTYEWDDMGSCEINDYDASKKIYFVDGSCTVTVDEDVVTVSGTFTGSDRNTYVVTVTYEAPYYTITDESVNGTVTAGVNGADVTKAKAGKTVLLNVAPADGYRFKSITASAPKDSVENFSELVALMGDAVFDGDENYNCGGYTCKVENGKFVVYDGTTFVKELSESNMTEFTPDTDYVEANSDNVEWTFYVENGEITGIDVADANADYDIIFSAVSGSKSTGTLQPVQLALTTVTEGSQYSFTMPNKPVTVTAEFEEAASATYTVTWKNGDTVLETDTDVAEGTTPTYNGEPPTKPDDEQNTYTFAAWDNGTTTYVLGVDDLPPVTGDVTYTAVFTATPKLFTGHSVTLGGDIGVNFFLNSDVLNNYSGTKTVKFTVDGKETTVDVPATATDNGYMVTCNVVAAQMAHKIKAVVYVDGTALDQTDSYSVQDYAEGVYKDENKPEKLRALAKAMLNYGAMAQTVFYNSLKEHPALANKTVGYNDYEAVTAEQIGDAVKGTSADLNKVAEKLGAEYYTSSLIYLSKNTLRLYFTPASKTVGALDGKGFSDSLSGYYYYVDHENIPAAELDEQKELKVGDYTFTYTALDYAKAVVNSGMGGDQKNLAKALFLYNQAANAYFTPVHTHTPGETVQENVVPASCTAAGSYDEVVYCTECHEELSREAKTIDKLAHTITEVAEVPATTEADGVAAHYECSVCHALFTDAQGSNETTAEALVIPQIVENVVDLSTLTKGYEAQDGDVLINALDGQKYIRIADGATVKLRNANITCLRNSSGIDIAGLTLLGDATIILEGTNVIRGGYEYCPGIHVPEGKTLTIDGTGSLDVSSNGRGFACGIGSNDGTNCGNIVINGGNITAYAGKAAGIGAKSGSSCGNITINGGTVNATSGDYGAGIGSTLYGKSICGDITINGGVVNATANYEGPGIGSGTSANCGNITITGGTVTAIGGEEGAGIGTGNNVSICGNILITGGTVIAKGGNKAAGIGSGYRNTTCGTITIADTVTQVTATKGTDAPNSIGAGDSGSCGTVTIADGANVTQN